MRLDFCVYHAFEREETSSIEQMHDKTACFFVCGLPHLCSVCVSIPAVLGVVWLALTRPDLSRLASSVSFLADELPYVSAKKM